MPITGPIGTLPGDNGSDFTNPVQTRQNLLIRTAPLRSRLTKTPFNGGVQPSTTGNNTTFLTMVTTEAPPLAMRIGFVNPFNAAVNLLSSSVWSTNTWGNADLGYGTSGNISVNPTGVGSKFYTASGGADVDAINDGSGPYGTSRNLLLPANPANGSNAAAPYSIQWTDWAPAPAALARPDGGAQSIYQIYATFAAGAYAGTSAFPNIFNTTPGAAQGRFVWTARAWNNFTNTDFADIPGSTGWTDQGVTPPWIIVQYISQSPGIQVHMSGDSISVAPTTDDMSWPMLRAAMSLSTPARPIEVSNLGWGGTSSAVYVPITAAAAAAIAPSIFVPQLITRNDGGSLANMSEVIAKHLINHGLMLKGAAPDCQLIWNIGGGEPTYDGISADTSGFVSIRNAFNAAAALPGGVPVIDAPSVIGNVPSAPWDYLAGQSNDGIHPNSVASAAITPLALAALQKVL